MEADKGSVGCDGGGESSSRVPPSSSSCSGDRQRFYIELRPGETTIVSWKRLVKDLNPSPPAIESSLTAAEESREAECALEGDFQDDQSTTKNNTFFVNTGNLEDLNEPVSSANCQSKKRRKNMEKAPEEIIDDHVPNKHAKLHGSVGVGNAPVMEQSSSHSHDEGANTEHHHDEKLQHPSSSPRVFSAKKAADTIPKSEYSSYSGPSNLGVSAFPIHAMETDKYKGRTSQYQNLVDCAKDLRELSPAAHKKDWERNSSRQFKPQAKRFVAEANELELSNDLQREKKPSNGLPDLNIPACPVQPLKSPSMHLQDVSSVKPKGTMLERAIRELEKIVAESRPPNLESQDVDTSSVAIKRRLPREVKQKLAKVARLAQSSQGKISNELINRLMSILGHLVQLRTLKRNLREMVLLGLSAKREKADRFQQIKKEVIEMIRLQAAKHRDGPANNFQEALSEDKAVFKGKYIMDTAMEDKICDLYDLYVQGMDEDKGPQIRKLYVELAELWPNGAMDNHGIKSAICRAKECRRASHDVEQVQQKERKKKLSMLKLEDVVRGEASSNVQAKAVRDKLITESQGHILALPTNVISCTATGEQNVGAPVRMPSPSLKGSNMDLPKQEKLEKMTFPMLKEQMKQQQREFESQIKKLSLKSEKESLKSHKWNVGHLDDLNHQLTAPPSCGRPS